MPDDDLEPDDSIPSPGTPEHRLRCIIATLDTIESMIAGLRRQAERMLAPIPDQEDP